jgi:cell wall-associated NlpC family hydrolase
LASARRVSRLPLALLATCTAAGVLLAVTPGSAAAEPKANLGQVRHQVAALHRQAEQAAERYNDVRLHQARVTVRLTQVTHRLEKAQRELTALRGTMGQIAAASYKAGGADLTMQLLLSEEPESFIEGATALDQLNRRQAESLRRIAVARQRLAQDRLAVQQQRDQADRLQSELREQKTAVEARLTRADALLATLTAAERARLAAATRASVSAAKAERRTVSRASRSSRPARSRTGTGSQPSYQGPASGRAAVAVRTAYAQLGDPYRWGASGPSSFDCSGLTSFAWRAAGVSLPHSSSAQYSSGRRVARSDLRPGDLVFFYSPISHVGIYVGGGRMIDAPYPGMSVKVTSISTMPYSGAVRP